MIIISHRLSMVRSCDFIIVLDQGQVVGVGPHEELRRSCPLYASLWMQQSDGIAG